MSIAKRAKPIELKPGRLYAPEEYLELIHTAEEHERFEYLDGVITTMMAESANHSIIVASFIGELYAVLRKRQCSVYSPNMRACVDQRAHFLPDVMVSCSPEYATDRGGQALVNPCLVIEVLSPSTIDRDLTEKLDRYKSTRSIQMIALASQHAVQVETYLRSRDGWTEKVLGPGERLELPWLEVGIELDDVYRGAQIDGRQ